MGHTPGPWILGSHGWMDEGRAHGSGGWSGRFRRIIGDDGVVARVYCGTDDTDEADSRHPNVLLIAAAPELLAALSQAVDVLTAHMDWQSGNIPGLEGAVELATNAINKAEGRSE